MYVSTNEKWFYMIQMNVKLYRIRRVNMHWFPSGVLKPYSLYRFEEEKKYARKKKEKYVR